MKTKTESLLELKGRNGKHDQSNASPKASGSADAEAYGHRREFGRRSFVKGLALGAASFLPVGAALADPDDRGRSLNRISDGDAAILRFLAAAEILETDLWQQYTEFADQDGPYVEALETIDDDMPTYVTQNT